MKASFHTRLRVSCLFGIFGSALFLAGDMLFYGALTSGAGFHPIDEMARKNADWLIVGGAIGPVAALASAIGMGLFSTLDAQHPRLARLAAGLLAAMILIGEAYHAVYTELGFAARFAEPLRTAMIAPIIRLRDAISYPMYTFGIAGTIIVYWLAFATRPCSLDRCQC